MALTINTDTWDREVSRHPTINALISSRLKLYVATVTYAVGDNYTTGGDVISLKNGKIKTYIAVIPIENDKGIVLRYITSSEKIFASGQLDDDAAGANSDAKALLELSSGSTIVNSMVATFLIIGR